MLASLFEIALLFSTLFFAALAAFYVSKYPGIDALRLFTVVVLGVASVAARLHFTGFGSSSRLSQQSIQKFHESFERSKSARNRMKTAPMQHSSSKTHHETTTAAKKMPAASRFDSPVATSATAPQPLPSHAITMPRTPTAETCAQVALEHYQSPTITHHQSVAKVRHGSIPIDTVLPRQLSRGKDSFLDYRVATAFQKDPYKINLSALPVYQHNEDDIITDEVYSPGYFEAGRPKSKKTNKEGPLSSSSSMEILEKEAAEEEPYTLYYSEEE